MKLITTLILASLSALPLGCAKTVNIQDYSSYKLCRLHILRPAQASIDTLTKADNQIQSRGLDCSQYENSVFQEEENRMRAFMEYQQEQQELQPYQRMQRNQCKQEGKYIRCSY